jgi:hypothetical protein
MSALRSALKNYPVLAIVSSRPPARPPYLDHKMDIGWTSLMQSVTLLDAMDTSLLKTNELIRFVAVGFVESATQ